ncbi:MAG: endonuclease domain-containing protein [Nanoarchaeota archaeon]|nr:endonuclease domain-containing protein [Nanoarchaeota archaeon]
MKRWTKKELNYLKNNYSNNLDKNISLKLGRSLKSISYVAVKYHLKKDREFYEKSRKKTNILFVKEELENKYFNEEKSMRKIAEEMNVGKTTIEHYFKKFKIKRRSHDEARKINPKKYAWAKGLTKKDPRISKIAESVKRAFNDKRIQKIKKLESKYGKPLNEVIYNLYWNKKYSQNEISEILGFDRSIIIKLMRNFNISKRPRYQYISSLKGEKHPLFGKSWETLLGRQKADKRKQESSDRFRKLTIKRLQNNEFPFFDTFIEKAMAEVLLSKGIPFVKQFNVDNRFVCDFAIPSSKIIIECDGDYWHGNPSIYNKEKLDKRQKMNIYRDKIKDKHLKDKGWKILRFFELDIKRELSKCVEKIENSL